MEIVDSEKGDLVVEVLYYSLHGIVDKKKCYNSKHDKYFRCLY